MRALLPLRHRLAFTLVELLVVVAIIGVLAAILLPAISQAPARAKRIKCVSNLRQIGIGFHTFAADHGQLFPMQVPLAEGGSLEFVPTPQAYRHFQVMSNNLETPRILLCPADTRQAASNWPSLLNPNVSYFVGLTATFTNPAAILAGDRNISSIATTGGQVIVNASAGWSSNLHQFKGNLLLSDGSVHQVNDAQLQQALLGGAQPVGN
jgi:prepilin-type N-terminal cleavage/methylation domain-containing protein